ncbi:pyridoxamine 5'-phosphate oxidase family protein [Nocardia paucivorans]|uniref:pyridoxamine 5'-phosphate oxidase family protein n=1 Tax=Nocardia paucivorans TaxID=114259 RepID=UPI0002E6156A|nr:pyridoxamine 5'-phosphate oxidase family protein [Nocardia paucivorans]
MTESEVPAGGDIGPRRVVTIERTEALRLLASVPFGRLVFTDDALPAVRPVTHMIADDGAVVVRTRPFPGLYSTMLRERSVVVAYEADEIDPAQGLGWSVVVTGPARIVAAPDLALEYARRLGRWAERGSGVFIGIEPTLVSGTRLIEEVVT